MQHCHERMSRRQNPTHAIIHENYNNVNQNPIEIKIYSPFIDSATTRICESDGGGVGVVAAG